MVEGIRLMLFDDRSLLPQHPRLLKGRQQEHFCDCRLTHLEAATESVEKGSKKKQGAAAVEAIGRIGQVVEYAAEDNGKYAISYNCRDWRGWIVP